MIRENLTFGALSAFGRSESALGIPKVLLECGEHSECSKRKSSRGLGSGAEMEDFLLLDNPTRGIPKASEDPVNWTPSASRFTLQALNAQGVAVGVVIPQFIANGLLVSTNPCSNGFSGLWLAFPVA